MDVKTLLWPTDFSENAAQALPVMTSLVQKYQTEAIGREQSKLGPVYLYGYSVQSCDPL